ncbi:hypothetical protein EDB89DRAFT_1919201, partial [Lactarius sanguifluus]
MRHGCVYLVQLVRASSNCTSTFRNGGIWRPRPQFFDRNRWDLRGPSSPLAFTIAAYASMSRVWTYTVWGLAQVSEIVSWPHRGQDIIPDAPGPVTCCDLALQVVEYTRQPFNGHGLSVPGGCIIIPSQHTAISEMRPKRAFVELLLVGRV